jgi:carbon monoxide dehydrogenase subunit G
MLRVERQKQIPSATPEDVFTMLSDPDGLSRLLPRLRKAELSDRGPDHARLVLFISIGSVFGTLRFEGNLHWVEPEQITLSVQNPLPATIHWSLTQADQGTDVKVTISLDLKPLLGPMVNFVPLNIVNEMIGKDLEHALREIASQIQTDKKPYTCPLPQLCLVSQAGLAF